MGSGSTKKNIFCRVFAEGSLPERHSLVLEKRQVFCEVFAEGSLPERHTLVLEKLVKVGSW